MNGRRPALWLTALLLPGCGGLPSAPATSTNIYVLEAMPASTAAARRDLTLAIGTPQARPGFDTARMAYVQQPHELNYFLTSRWAATPARMLEPLLAQALQQSGGFRAVVTADGVVAGDWRLETEIIRLQHDFTTRPSRVRLGLRAQLVDLRSKRLLASRAFDETEPASHEDAYGGVLAANRALQRLLEELIRFCLTAPAGP